MTRLTRHRPEWYTLAGLTVLAILSVPVIQPAAQEGYVHLNPVVEKMSQGKTVFGVQTADLSLQNARKLALVEDIDYVYIDFEHSPMRFDQMEQFLAYLTAADKGGILKRRNGQSHPAVFARFMPYGREDVQWVVKHALDMGLSGIFINNLETKEQAEAIVHTIRPVQRRDSKIPFPVGGRGSVSCGFWGLGLTAPGECRTRADLWPLNPQGDMIFWPMIETKLGVQNADAIAQVPGVSGFYLGSGGDLSSSYGVTSATDPDVEGAFRQILTVCKARKIYCGGTTNAGNAAKKIADGYNIVGFGNVDDGGLGHLNEAARLAAIKGGAKR